MPFAVIQTDNIAITPEQLGPAMVATQRYTRADGIKIARECYGLIVDKLEHHEALQLNDALAAQGVNSTVIDEADLIDLPPIKVPKRIDCLDEHLVIYDVLGRPRELAWDQILVVAAGQVNIYETKVTEETRWEPSGGGAMVGGIGFSSGGTEATVHRSTKGFESARLVLELIVADEPARYRAQAEGLLYNYLGDRKARDLRDNFLLLTQDLVSRATSAVFNQGSVALSMNPDEAFTYDTRRAFEREIIWLIWWGSRAR